MEESQKNPMPKKACLVSLMFSCTDDKQAFALKEQIDLLVKEIPEKRYTFQIVEQ